MASRKYRAEICRAGTARVYRNCRGGVFRVYVVTATLDDVKALQIAQACAAALNGRKLDILPYSPLQIHKGYELRGIGGRSVAYVNDPRTLRRLVANFPMARYSWLDYFIQQG